VSSSASCHICGNRPPKRFCPALGEKICPACCGRDREVSIDCPSDCTHLIAAHRYAAEHREQPKPDEVPYRTIEFPADFVYERWQVVTAVAGSLLEFAAHNKDLRDTDVFLSLGALAETYRTLGSGIYYERPPDASMARLLYGHLSVFIKDFRKQAVQGGFSIPESDIFRLLVFLLRVFKQQTNGRPLSRAALDFLRARFPLPQSTSREPSRIIVP
jgi:hypothetical protein